jgi:RNA polymerase sigma-70 factor (ECF subfamily)
MKDCSADMELAQRAARGEQESWRAIYDSTSDRLFSLLCGIVRDRDEALDLLQETYVQALRRIDSFRGEAPLEAWLRAIAVRKALDWRRSVLRRLRRTVPLTEGTATVDPVGPARAEAACDRLTLMEALSRISPSQRAALLLRECEGMSFKEVASVLGCKESTARVHHAKARERMREVLGTEIGDVGTGSSTADCLEGQST